MARKNTLFDVDITEENPLITIVNHGKIPIVEMQNVQFRRFKAVSLFEKHDKWIEVCKKNGINYVTYCNIGGFHGVDFSHWMIMENINIGYVEPDTLVFDNTSGAVVTAKRKLQSVKNAWDSLLKKENENDIPKMKSVKNDLINRILSGNLLNSVEHIKIYIIENWK